MRIQNHLITTTDVAARLGRRSLLADAAIRVVGVGFDSNFDI